MRNTPLKLLCVITICSSFLSSCKEKISIDVPGAAPILVIESEVTTEVDSSYVKLTLSSNYFSVANYPVVSNASVSVNAIPFTFDPIKQRYIPSSGYVGKTNTDYNLVVSVNGKTYTSQARLERMFRIDSFFQTYKNKEGFFHAGYSVSYAGFDDRPPIKYTYFLNGKFDTINRVDSFNNNKILFDSEHTQIGQPFVFEIPFTRFDPGYIYSYIFRSVDKNMRDFLMAFQSQSSGAPGPFQVPPANLPTNITGGALGYFATYDVVRGRYKVK